MARGWMPNGNWPPQTFGTCMER
jgi:hypothetical protein